jgi:hypothetical protein
MGQGALQQIFVAEAIAKSLFERARIEDADKVTISGERFRSLWRMSHGTTTP